MKQMVLVLALLGVMAGGVWGASISQKDALSRAFSWMAGNPVMSTASQTAGSVETFPNLGKYSVYVVSLVPKGYLIINSDDRLPLLVSFSADSSVDLSDDPRNALRAMLLGYCERMEEELALPVSLSAALADAPMVEDELYGPFLETSWNQNNPYNLLCPENPSGSEDYDYRAAVGCVPAAFAQILKFHCWPYFGTGSHSYTDDNPIITGSYSAGFSDHYDWASMQPSYDIWNTDPDSSKDAVAELMYELAVAAEVDYSTNGTSSSTFTLGNRLGDYFFFDPIDYHYSQSALISPLEADLRAGFPCVVSIPGHAIVADGLMVDGGTTTYHINYGWGGENNGWYTSIGIPGGVLSSGVTSLRPSLMAFPQTNAVVAGAGGAVEVKWILPKRLETEVSQLEIMRYNESSTAWESFAVDTTLTSRRFSEVTSVWDDCDDFSIFELTTTDQIYTQDWISTNITGVGGCFYKSGPEYSNCVYNLTSLSTITPNDLTRLLLHAKYMLSMDEFQILVSADGNSFTKIWSASGMLDWGDIAVDLSDYSGQAIYIRLEYVSERYFLDGGVWIDSISTQEVTNLELEGQPIYYTTLSNLTAGTQTLAAVLTDTNLVEHALGPSFTLTVSDGGNDIDSDGLPDDWELQYFGGETNANPFAIAANGLNTVMQAYIAGLNPTNSDSFFNTALVNGYVVQWNTTSGRVYSVWSTTNLLDGFQTLETSVPWPQSSWTDSVERAGNYYRVDVTLP